MAFLKQMKRKHDHRTIVVPTITSLNPDTWKEIPGQGGETWNDLKLPGTWPPHVINTYKIHDGYVQSNMKKYGKRLHILCGFSLFLTCTFSHFVGQKFKKKPFVSNAVRVFGGQTLAVCLLTTTSDVWQFSCGFHRFPMIFAWRPTANGHS